MVLFAADRAKLKGAIIRTGDRKSNDLIYTFSSNISSCDSYGTSGSSVCDDIILIKITHPLPVHWLYLYFSETADEIILCEVEVFVGKFRLKGDEQEISRDRNCKRSRQNCRQQGNILTISVRKHFCIEIIYSLSKI